MPFRKECILPDCLFPYREMDVQAFLVARRSFLANFKVGGRPFHELLRTVCLEHNVNPKLLLVSLQREQSLITRPVAPMEAVLNRAMGFGCTDGGDMPQFYGLERQLRKAAQYYRLFFDRWMPGKPMRIDDGADKVTPANAFTSSLYEYTPWAGDIQRGGNVPPFGGKLTWLIWCRWWPTDVG
ncbi:MAG: hypothetical protein GX410_01710 [Elusimicrobia bacterium]|nr:hypothetical protein [Elusimicrobiota bacterium]